MQNALLRCVLPPSLLAGLVLLGCVKEISSEERLERESPHQREEKSFPIEELLKVRCDDTKAELDKARNENRPENERVQGYIDVYENLGKRIATLDEAMTRNPDLAYREGSQELVAHKDACVAQRADVRNEFERYVRELVDVPTVREVKGGSEVVVARLDFGVLRQAIDTLATDDKETLLGKVGAAEKKLEVVKSQEVGKKKGGR